jgi:hypothetical protein
MAANEVLKMEPCNAAPLVTHILMQKLVYGLKWCLDSTNLERGIRKSVG